MKALRFSVLISMISLCLLLPNLVSGQEKDKVKQNKRFWTIDNQADVRDGELTEPYYNIPELRSENGVLDIDLHVRYQKYRLGTDTVELRSYWHPKLGCLGPQGPTIRCQPDDKVTITIHNDLPMQSMDPHLKGRSRHHNHRRDHNIPHGFNITNFHTHGWHVSPYQDDIFRRINPSYVSQYQYQLYNHTPGTFWYHPHVHGSTSLQVAGGMAGALIIDDKPGSLSQFPALAEASKPEHEKIMVINEVAYVQNANYPKCKRKKVKSGGVGWLTDFTMLEWLRAKRPKEIYPMGTTINGRVRPEINMAPGEVQRWRIVQSGFMSNVAMHFDDRLEVVQIATDGILYKQVVPVKSIHLAPGNRVDVLVRLRPDQQNGSEGQRLDIKSVEYHPECEYFPNDKVCQSPADEGDEILMHVKITGAPQDMKMPQALPGPAAGHEDIDPNSIVKERTTNFSLDFSWPKGKKFNVNGHVFEMGRIDELPLLGTTERWHVIAGKQSHPYHIHVNPFQVVEYGGRKLSTPIWKDVVLVRSKSAEFKFGEPEKYPSGQGDAKILTRYRKYHGDFVLHCHILHHEDQGMMQRIRIVRTRDESDLDRKHRIQMPMKHH